jgi:hypothetical protein
MSSGVRVAAVVLLALAAGSCRRAEKPRTELVAVERCESGVLRAVEAPTRVEGSRIYHEACKDIYVEPVCREAFGAAAHGDPDQSVVLVGNSCNKAYCRILPNAAELEACRPNFRMTLENALTAWPPLHNAIILHDAKGFSPRVLSALFRFYARGTKPWPKSAGEASSDASAPPANSAQPAVPASVPEPHE